MRKSFIALIFSGLLIFAGLLMIGCTYLDNYKSSKENNALITEFENALPQKSENANISDSESLENATFDNEDETSTSGTIVNDEYQFTQFDGYEIVCKMEIPSIELVDIVLEGENLDNLKVGLGHFSNTPLPGNGVNFCVCGHNGSRYGVMFSNLQGIEIGDEIIITMNTGSVITYEVYDFFVIEPTDFSILDQYDDGLDRITLMTCTNHGKQRFVVRGKAI